jgi:hypothetical protein
VTPPFRTKLPYHPIKDLAPIGLGVYVPFLLLTHPSVPAKTVKELVDLAKAKPATINFGSPGSGTPNHLGMELLKAMTGAQIVHVPYKGGGPATVDLVAGRIQAIFGSIPQWQPFLASGKVRAVGVGHPKRLKSMPWLSIAPRSWLTSILFWRAICVIAWSMSASETLTPEVAARAICSFCTIRRLSSWRSSTSRGGSCEGLLAYCVVTALTWLSSSLCSTTSSSTTATMRSSGWVAGCAPAQPSSD